MSENKEMPEWIKELTAGKFEVKTDEGTFELEDIDYETLSSAKKRAEVSKGEAEVFILAKMIRVKDKQAISLGELAILKFKTKTIARLMWAVNKITGAEDFL